MKVHRYLWPAMQGALMALVPVAIGAMVGWYLLAPEPSLDRICARNNERGSSAWVACVDRMIQERK